MLGHAAQSRITVPGFWESRHCGRRHRRRCHGSCRPRIETTAAITITATSPTPVARKIESRFQGLPRLSTNVRVVDARCGAYEETATSSSAGESSRATSSKSMVTSSSGAADPVAGGGEGRTVAADPGLVITDSRVAFRALPESQSWSTLRADATAAFRRSGRFCGDFAAGGVLAGVGCGAAGTLASAVAASDSCRGIRLAFTCAVCSIGRASSRRRRRRRSRNCRLRRTGRRRCGHRRRAGNCGLRRIAWRRRLHLTSSRCRYRHRAQRWHLRASRLVPKSQLALAARSLPQPAVTLESELVQPALRPQFDLAAAWTASIPGLLSGQSPRWVLSSLQLDLKSRLAVAARPLPQPVALRWVWRSRVPTQRLAASIPVPQTEAQSKLSTGHSRAASLQAGEKRIRRHARGRCSGAVAFRMRASAHGGVGDVDPGGSLSGRLPAGSWCHRRRR